MFLLLFMAQVAVAQHSPPPQSALKSRVSVTEPDYAQGEFVVYTTEDVIRLRSATGLSTHDVLEGIGIADTAALTIRQGAYYLRPIRVVFH